MLARTISIIIILAVAFLIAGLGIMIKKEEIKIKKDWSLPKWLTSKFPK